MNRSDTKGEELRLRPVSGGGTTSTGCLCEKSLAPGRIRELLTSAAFLPPPSCTMLPLAKPSVCCSHLSSLYHAVLSLLGPLCAHLPSLPAHNRCSFCMHRKVTRFCSVLGARRKSFPLVQCSQCLQCLCTSRPS